MAHAYNPTYSGGREIRRIVVQSQPWKIIHQTLFQQTPSQKRAGGMAQGIGPEVNLQYHNKTK
jgi:hypothetical protein